MHHWSVDQLDALPWPELMAEFLEARMLWRMKG